MMQGGYPAGGQPGYSQYPAQVPQGYQPGYGPPQPAGGYGYGQPGQPGVTYGQPAMPAAYGQQSFQPSYATPAQQQPYPPAGAGPENVNVQLPPNVTVDKLPIADDDEAPMASAPPSHTMDVIQGYDAVAMDDVRLAPPSYEEVIRESEDISRPPVHDIPVISEQEARDCLVEYCDRKCCYGKGAARTMTIGNMRSTSAFHYVLNTFGEARSTAWVHEPYTGGVLDIPANGPAPLPWDIPLSPPEKFKDFTLCVEVPHTASVKPCHRCYGMGRLRCRHCTGHGQTRCSCVSGYTGFGSDRKPCTWCHGSGYRRCWKCHGHGHVCCNVCKGNCQLKWYIKLTVAWTNHMDDYILERTAMPDKNVRKAQGETIFQEEQPLVIPVNHCSEQPVNMASIELVQKHRTQFNTERILVQNHCIRVVPVTEVECEWKNKDFIFFVYGLDRLVYTADYPQTCCCGCNIL